MILMASIYHHIVCASLILVIYVVLNLFKIQVRSFMQAIGKAVGEGLTGSQDRKVIEKVINSVNISLPINF